MTTLLLDLSQPALLTWLLKATALLVAAFAATTLLSRASAGARHLVWLATLVAVLTLPALSLWSPVRLAILPSRLTERVTKVNATHREAGAPPAAARTREAPAIQPRTNAKETPQVAVATEGSLGQVADKPAFPPGATVIVLWTSITAALLAWLGYGALSVRSIVRRARPLDEARWMTALCDIADRLDLDAVPRLVASNRVEMPFACGILQPTIVLPDSAETWSADRRRAVLFHELAHVRRRDLVGHTLGRLACALYWFHPLIWTAARRLRAESERACDDLVLSCGARASDYADHLLDLVVGVRRHAAPATALPMARRRELEGRVLAILDPAVRRVAPSRLQSAGLIALLGVLALAVAAMAPAPAVSGLPALAATPVLPNGVGRDSVAAATGDTSLAVLRAGANAISNQRGSPAGALQNERNPQNEPTVQKEPTPQNESSPRNVVAAAQQVLGAAVGSVAEEMVKRTAAALMSSGEGAKRSPEAVRADSERVKLLARVLRSDPDAKVRRTAAWGLNEVGDFVAASDALTEALRRDEDAAVREMAAWALAGTKREVVHRALAEALKGDASDEVRESAAWALANGDARDFHEAFAAALADASSEVRESAAWALGVSGRRPAPRALIAALGDRDAEVREMAAWALAEIEDADTGPALLEAFMKETSTEVKLAELRALSFLSAQDKRVLDAALASKDAELRARAVRLLAGGSAGVWPEPRPRPRPRPYPD